MGWGERMVWSGGERRFEGDREKGMGGGRGWYGVGVEEGVGWGVRKVLGGERG